jgi:hypothetical protein
MKTALSLIMLLASIQVMASTQIPGDGYAKSGSDLPCNSAQKQEALRISGEHARYNCFRSGHTGCKVLSNIVTKNTDGICQTIAVAEGLQTRSRVETYAAKSEVIAAQGKECSGTEKERAKTIASNFAMKNCQEEYDSCKLQFSYIYAYQNRLCQGKAIVFGF